MDFGPSFVNLGQHPFDARRPLIASPRLGDRVDETRGEIVRHGDACELSYPVERYALESGFVVPERVVLTLALGAVMLVAAVDDPLRFVRCRFGERPGTRDAKVALGRAAHEIDDSGAWAVASTPFVSLGGVSASARRMGPVG